jgi:hypothetical protein
LRRVVAEAGPPDWLAAARRRLEGTTNVDYRQGELEHQPI